ncbi:hypothetical protein ACH42_17040 [Endozoicomonas sp. (ex Bugula neritina AB1)]|nr:hypothetical protein ACH42_17040 [Endozoicomonas sp. (ex Bugula neritina AB1)]
METFSPSRLNVIRGFDLYHHQIKASVTVNSLSFSGVVNLLSSGVIKYISSQHSSNGSVSFSLLPEIFSDQQFTLIVNFEGRIFASELVTPDNIVNYDLAISTTGGSAPTGNPGTITGKVERIIDGKAEAAARTLVAVENKPDGSWGVTGNTTSDDTTGDYTLDVLTDGGDTFVIAMDDYGRVFTANATVELNEIIHPTTPNGYVYRVKQAGTLPATEPEWWIDTGTNHTKTVNDVTLRAIAFYRPLCHGYIKAELNE